MLNNWSEKNKLMTEKRYNEICNQLDPSIASLLNLIRNYLQANQAAVMVGAGFSKNADINTGAKMKDWNELAEDFYNQLYSRVPEDVDLVFRSPIRLASQLASYTSHAELDKVISNSLQDGAASPGILHKKLMQLPWRDVFTTNYDTLLERTSKDWKQHYNVVTNRESLIYSKSPRIIKLHGSFPNQHPFIITEEDFRTYPNEHPEFVNTVRQSLIENLFCLIGFSGDDENFLSWIGWLRDVIGKESVLCYLITYNEQHDSELSLMVDRGIRPINLKRLPLKDNEGIKEALDFFLTYVTPHDNHDVEEWSGELDAYFPYESLTEDLIEKMTKIRESYPDWPFLPADRLNDFQDVERCAPFIGDKISVLKDEQKFRFVQELIWRIRISYAPLVPEWIVTYVEKLVEDTYVLSTEIIDMALVLLSSYRKNGEFEKFENMCRNLEKDKNILTSLQLHLFTYERALFYISRYNASQLKDFLSTWDVAAEDTIPVLWKSNMLTFVGDMNGAKVLLEAAILHVETQCRISNSTNQQMLLDVLYTSLSALGGKLDTHIAVKKSLYLTYVDKLKMDLLNYEKKKQPGQHVIHTFNIGKKIHSWYGGTSGLFGSYIYPYRYVTMREQMGYPMSTDMYVIDVEHSKMFLKYLVLYNPEYAIEYAVRCMDSELVKEVFTREILHSWQPEKCESIYDLFRTFIEEPKTQVEERIRKKVLIPLLSRMCIRLKQASIKNIFNVVLNAVLERPKRYDWYRDELSIIYDCADEQLKGYMLQKCLKTPIPPINTPWDILKPECFANEITISDEIINILDNAFLDSNCDIKIALCRIQNIWRWLTADQKQQLSARIINWRANKETVVAIRTYSYVEATKEEREFIQTLCQRKIEVLQMFGWNGAEKSQERDNITDSLKTLVILSDYLDVNQIEAVYEKLINLVEDVYNDNTAEGVVVFPWCVENQDFITFDRCFRNFIRNTHEKIVGQDFTQTLLKKLEYMDKDKSPFLEIRLRLLPLTLWGDKFIQRQLNSRIYSRLKNAQDDGLLALRYALNKDLNCKKFIGGMLSFMKKTKEEVLVLYLQYCVDILLMKIDDSVANTYSSMLKEMLTLITDKELSFDFKTDVCYYAGRLVGIMSQMKILRTDVVDSWKKVLEDSQTDSDVRNSYEQGVLLYQRALAYQKTLN